MAFRRIVAELSNSANEEMPSPLEGIRPEVLVRGIGAALEAGLADDLDWLDAGAAGAALYQIAAALPPGTEQREVGRRVLARLLQAKSDAFAVMATQMARAGGKLLLSPAVFARVALLVELPIALELRDGPLAFAIASRRNLAREYVIGPSTRSLPERRLAARLLERAARDALRRAQLGDRAGLSIVGPFGSLEAVWHRLLGDREPLVFRHVAIARGLLSPLIEDGIQKIEEDFAPELSPTEWRRAAAALGGLCASRPQDALRIASRALAGGLLTRDPGAIAPYLWGLSRAAESEPEAAREMFELLPSSRPEDIADAALVLARELGSTPFVDAIREKASGAIVASVRRDGPDDGAVALRTSLVRALDRGAEDDDVPISEMLDRAILAFAEEGARAAYDRGLELLDAAQGTVDALVAIGDEGEASASALSRRTSFAVVRELDMAVLERDALMNLLRLDPREAQVRHAEQAVEVLRDRVFVWLVERELEPLGTMPHQTPHLLVHLARLKALLHLLDGQAQGRVDELEHDAIGRLRHAARSIVVCLSQSPPPMLRRAVIATFARSLDALARIGACDISDVALVAAGCLRDARDLATLAEASMDPDTRSLLGRLSPLARGSGALTSVESLADDLVKPGTARSDGLRAVLLRLHHALSAIARARSLAELVQGGEIDAALAVENACFALAQVHTGARARILDAMEDDAARAPSRALSSRLARVAAGGDPLSVEDAALLAREVGEGVPAALANVVVASLSRLPALPFTCPDPPEAPAPADERDKDVVAAELPAWIPARRALGAFYVERPLAAGGVGSVFVVTRLEDRHDPRAERFALKVPDYNANAARHLSEAQFLALFRSEASALVALPPHENLAHFVTFDLAARPKPILVMELVEGPNLERLIDTRNFDTARAIQVIDDVAKGLEAMHAAEVGHLDLKPANIVLRHGATGVLVDFGLAGRSIRLGCGSAAYAPPEVWAYQGDGATPMAVDVYAFAALAFETLTCHLLFDGETEVTLVSQHLAHDGLPPKLRAFSRDSRFTPIAELLFAALRRDPRSRISMSVLRAELARTLARVKNMAWPLLLPA